jgi:hypothetical protein
MNLQKQLFNLILAVLLFVGLTPSIGGGRASSADENAVVPVLTEQVAFHAAADTLWIHAAADLVEPSEGVASPLQRFEFSSTLVFLSAFFRVTVLTWPVHSYQFAFHSGFSSGLAPPSPRHA